MDEAASRIAASANAISYDSQIFKDYIDTAPHLKHASLKTFYAELVNQLFDRAAKHTTKPEVLDLGAGGIGYSAISGSRGQRDGSRHLQPPARGPANDMCSVWR